MKKNITISILLINLLIFIFLAFYVYFRPEQESSEKVIQSTPTIPYDGLKDYLLSSGDFSIHYLFFCAPTDTDCNYIQNTIIKPLEAKQGQSLFERIDYIDISDLLANLEKNKLATDWGVTSYPAFIAVSVENGEFAVLNSIQYTTDDPINELDLKRWLAENEIWTGLFEQSDLKIEIPK